MSQIPPPNSPFPGAAGYPPPPGPYPPPKSGSSAWKWIVGVLGLLVLMPCMCCIGILSWSMTIKDLAISNGQHLGGPPMNVRFDYAFNNDGSREPAKAFYIVVESANGTRREQSVVGGFGFGFGQRSVPMRGTWQFFAGGDLVGPEHEGAVRVWIESEDSRGNRSTASNTLRIYPKS